MMDKMKRAARISLEWLVFAGVMIIMLLCAQRT